jgi:hypothetical protein
MKTGMEGEVDSALREIIVYTYKATSIVDEIF